VSITARQKRRIRRTQESARERRELESHHHSLIPLQPRHPDYWRDLSVEIGGTIISAVLVFGFARVFGYIERPSVRSELLRLLGLVAVAFAVVLASVRVRRVRSDHPGASNARLFTAYLRAIGPHWSIPMLLVGVALCLGYY
jgi:hypothetical protein